MRLYRFLVVWLNHFALNLGGCLSHLYFALIPPQFTTHTAKQLEYLEGTDPVSEFVSGLLGR